MPVVITPRKEDVWVFLRKESENGPSLLPSPSLDIGKVRVEGQV